MSTLILMSWSSPASEDRTADFHAWYDDVHVPQVSEILDVTAKVNRYQTLGAGTSPRFLTVYEIGDGFDPTTAAAQLREASESGTLTPTDALDMTVAPPEMQWVRREA